MKIKPCPLFCQKVGREGRTVQNHCNMSGEKCQTGRINEDIVKHDNKRNHGLIRPLHALSHSFVETRKALANAKLANFLDLII